MSRMYVLHIEHINVVRLQLVQGVLDRDVEGLATIASGVAMYNTIMTFVTTEIGGIFGSKDHLIANARMFMHP